MGCDPKLPVDATGTRSHGSKLDEWRPETAKNRKRHTYSYYGHVLPNYIAQRTLKAAQSTSQGLRRPPMSAI